MAGVATICLASNAFSLVPALLHVGAESTRLRSEHTTTWHVLCPRLVESMRMEEGAAGLVAVAMAHHISASHCRAAIGLLTKE
jgi:hypothetical protein